MQLFDRIKQAHRAIRPQVLVTPLDHSLVLSGALGCEVWLKNELLQPTGSFKVRGATNKVRLLDADARERGVVTASTGNHGQAVARAGRLAGVPVTVYLPASTAPPKMAGIRALGGELVVVDGPPIDAELLARETAAEDGRTYIPPYNDFDIMAGQGTLGMELHEQAPDLDAVFIAVGGGGLIGGTGTALKGLGAETKVVGVWCENSAVMLRCLEAGRIIEVPERPTLTDGTAGAVETGSVTFPVCQRVIDDRVVVDEAGIADGMRRVAEAERWMIEGSAGMAMAGLVKAAERYQGAKVAVVLCGRNIASRDFAKVVLGS
jgi:threonine dehydratase